MPLALARRVAGQIADQERPRADEAEVIAQDIDELGQLVEAPAAQEEAGGSQPLVVRKKVAIGAAGTGHGAELDEPEDALAQADPLLPEENGRAEAYPDDRRRCQEDRREQDQCRDRDGKVEATLAHARVKISGGPDLSMPDGCRHARRSCVRRGELRRLRYRSTVLGAKVQKIHQRENLLRLDIDDDQALQGCR